MDLEKVSYLEEAHWSNHRLPTPQRGAALFSMSLSSPPPSWSSARYTAGLDQNLAPHPYFSGGIINRVGILVFPNDHLTYLFYCAISFIHYHVQYIAGSTSYQCTVYIYIWQGLLVILHFFVYLKVTWHTAKYGDTFSELVLCIYPIQSAHTHSSEHTYTLWTV